MCDHNLQLCDITQFEVATTPEDRQLKEKRDRSMISYYKNHEKNIKRQENIMKNIEKKDCIALKKLYLLS